MYYVYVLKSLSGELYYGYTSDLRKRIRQHNAGESFSTKNQRWSLVYYEAYRSRDDAMIREKRIKNYGQALGQLKRRIKKSLNIS